MRSTTCSTRRSTTARCAVKCQCFLKACLCNRPCTFCVCLSGALAGNSRASGPATAEDTRRTAEWPRPCVHGAQQNYNKYVEPYLNKIPRASTSTTSTPGRRTGTAYDSTAESSGMGQPNMGMGLSNTGMGQSNTGKGQPQGGMGQSNMGMGMGQSHTGMGQSNMGMGQPQGGMGQSSMGMGQGGLNQSNMGMGQGGMGQSSMPMGQAQGGGVDPNGGFTVTHTTTTKKAL